MAGPAGALASCDIVFGCVDGFAERRELEIACRRHLIPLIDIGMDVHIVGKEPPRMGGQVILSMPGSRCMKCLGFLSDASLAREAALYGDAGPRPQVVWPNGVLASTAVGVAVDLLTNWTRLAQRRRVSDVRRQRRYHRAASAACARRRLSVPALSARPNRPAEFQENLKASWLGGRLMGNAVGTSPGHGG